MYLRSYCIAMALFFYLKKQNVKLKVSGRNCLILTLRMLKKVIPRRNDEGILFIKLDLI